MTSKIKFWPDKVAHTLDVEISIEGVHLTFTLDLEEAYQTEEDLIGAMRIVENSFDEGI